MIRRLIMELFLFLLPFALYGLYWRMIGRAAATDDKKSHPWVLLTIVGLVLVILSFVWWALSDGAGPDGVYIPDHMENGEIVPGGFGPPPQAP
ncbi:MAG: hypothetical protein RJB62_1368 [Pseudomonadota bacterium]|jgi:hypothetical protein